MKSSSANIQSHTANPKKERIQIEVQPSLLVELDGYVIESDLGSRRELFNNMVALWRWATQVNRKGSSVAAINTDDLSYNILTMPALEAIKSQPSKNYLRGPMLSSAKVNRELATAD